MRILVTGGAGFIGSTFLNLFVPRFPEHEFLNLDVLNYAANMQNLADLEGHENLGFVRLDLADQSALLAQVEAFRPDWVFHFAAETHVDRSIRNPSAFLHSNTHGTFSLLEACRQVWGSDSSGRFVSVSTDEVYGSLGASGHFSESSSYSPNSPYSASKAAADHFARAYHHTYGLPVIITNCSNNYGPRQFPEKLIPLMILNAFADRPLPVYGDGSNVRDWLYVEDHCEALWQVAEKGVPGETYCIGGGYDVPNLQIVKLIAEIVAQRRGLPAGALDGLIRFVEDRPGHDFRYAIDSSKIRREIGWQPRALFREGLERTIDWYANNSAWVESVQSGEYREWMRTHYGVTDPAEGRA